MRVRETLLVEILDYRINTLLPPSKCGFAAEIGNNRLRILMRMAQRISLLDPISKIVSCVRRYIVFSLHFLMFITLSAAYFVFNYFT